MGRRERCQGLKLELLNLVNLFNSVPNSIDTRDRRSLNLRQSWGMAMTLVKLIVITVVIILSILLFGRFLF